ncbi:NADP-dependent oxidoreductase domain [Trinorchestia longiramus]|nr:NADP-dependent oxidoreductase domain [Trinorchestia longiramus]
MGVDVPNVKLNSGASIPILGLGTWKSPPGEVGNAIKEALAAGYRHFDCAHVYCNEKEVGQAFKTAFDEGIVKREELFITSKLWNTFHSRASVLPALKQTLSDLGLAYLDLYLIHWPVALKENTGELHPTGSDGKPSLSDADYVDTWLEMEEAVKQGLVKAIGVSNFSKDQIERILAVCTIPPANNQVPPANNQVPPAYNQVPPAYNQVPPANDQVPPANDQVPPANDQVECHPYLAQVKLIEYCKSKGISVTAYSPLGSPDRPWLKQDEPVVMNDPLIQTLASKYGVTVAQLLIKFQVQRGVICIPKSVTKSRIIENIEVWGFTISDEDVAAMAALNKPFRAVPSTLYEESPFYPFNAEY